jgi:DNA-binding NarL/FixJ family response regulator
LGPLVCQPSIPTLRILVVEDDALLSRDISRALIRVGCEVIAAPSCLAARALGCRFDVGVLDIDLCDGCGVELGHGLLDSELVERVVFFTTELDPKRLARASRLGPVIQQREGVDALVPVVAGTMGTGAVRQSRIVPKGEPEDTSEETPPIRGAHGAA